MQVEQAFRDLNAPRHGFALRHNRGREARVATLLLIAALAMVAVWLTGLAGYARGLDRALQANTELRRALLSVFLGQSTAGETRPHYSARVAASAR